MLSSTQNIAAKPAALPPAVQASLPANSAGGPSFAQFLTDQAPPPPPTEDEAAPPENAADAAQPATPQTRRAPVAARPTGQARAPDGAAKAEPKAEPKAAAGTVSDAAQATEEETAEPSELKEFTQLIGLNAPATPVQPDVATAAAQDGHRTARRGAVDVAGSDTPPLRNAGRSPLDAASSAGDAGQTAQARSVDRLAGQAAQADERAARNDLLQAASSATQGGQDAPPGIAQPATGTPSFAAALAQALPAQPGAADVAAQATTHAVLREPLHGAAFAPELGARVSLLAVDGVQHAELQLNPADMGPVSVQIVVDGSQAQVSFHALQAETRQALEQSLPDLAAALQGQGLTLSGGGVFQQASRDAERGAGEAANPAGARPGSAGGHAGAEPAAAPVRRTVGLLDTFA
jgi:flagellar hook-length control protein FliK